MSNEREILAYSLPPEEGSAAADFEQRLLPKGPRCPLTADLFLLAEGKAARAVAEPLEKHLEECARCLASFHAFKQALKETTRHPDPQPEEAAAESAPPTLCLAPWTPLAAGPTTMGVAKLPGRTSGGRQPPVESCHEGADASRVPAAVAAPATAAAWDPMVRRVVDLFTSGASAGRLLEETGLPPGDLLTALCAARDLHGPGELVLQAVAGPSPPPGARKSLLDLLQARSKCLRNVTVRQSRDTEAGTEGKRSWDECIRYFSFEVAPLLVSLLSQVSHVGVAWGRTVASAIAGVKRACESLRERLHGPVVCVATAGGLVGELKVRVESSSSILASRLAEAINGDWEHLCTLHGVEAFISFLDSSDEIDTIRKRISRFPNYKAVFGGPDQPGVIDQLDAIVTSCGNAHHYNQFWTTELPRLGVSPEKLNSLTHGNIGGVLLEREDLDARDRALFEDIARRWTGITRRHYEQCALRRPGVILLALGYNKADVVLKCVELGLVTELIIDEDLAMALWDKVDPQKDYPRTLEAVLCRQIPLNRVS